MDVDRRKSSLCSWERESDARDCCFPACEETESMEVIRNSISAFNKDREKRSLCSWDSDSGVRDYGCLPCEDAEDHTKSCTSGWVHNTDDASTFVATPPALLNMQIVRRSP